MDARKCWLSRQNNGLYMITKFRPIKNRIGLSDKEDLYVTAGDPMSIKNMCEWAVEYIWNIQLDKLESKRVYVKGGELSRTGMNKV